MDRASRRVRSTAQDMEAAKRAVDRYIMAIGAAGVAFASAAAAMAVNAAKSMDATAKMAQQIGTTTEALTGMRFAAQQFANIGDQQFDMAMRRMTRRIAEAAEGSGAAKNALDAMGLSARELARLSPDKQMLAIADAMQRTERQADRLRYTMAIFDTEGMALVPALQQGAAAFEQNIELAKRFGVVLSTEAAQAAEQFTSNMSLLAARQEGFKNQLAEAVLPMLADLSGRLVEITQRIGPMGDTIEKALKAAGAAAAATAAIFVSRLIGSITASVTAWIAATAEAARYQMTLARMAAEAAKASTAITAMTGAAAGGMAVMGRAAQLALGVLGGPAGLLITTGLTAAAFLAMGRDARTAATDVDALTESLDTYNRRQLESAAFNLENDLVELNRQAEEHGQILRTLNADYEALTERYGENYEGLRNVRQAIREEEESLESVIATIAKKSPLLAQITQRLWDMDAASRGAAGGVEALNQAMHSEAGEKYLAQLQSQIKALQDGGDPIKMATRWISEHADATDADKAAIMSAAHALKALQDARDKASRSAREATKALTEAQRAAQNFRREQDQSLRSQLQSVSAIHSQAQAIEDQIAVYGLGKTAIEDLTIARLEEQAAILSGFEGSQELVEAIKREIEARKRLRTAIGSLEQKEAERQAWEEWARDVEQIFDRVGQSLTDAIFDGGKSGKELLRDMFKSLTFNVLINPVVGAMQGWVTDQLGGMFGYRNPQQGGGIFDTVSSATGIVNALTGGTATMLATGIANMGATFGSAAATAFGSGMAAGATGGFGTASAISSAASAAGGAAGSGAAAAGAWIGAAAPWLLGGLAIAGGLGLFDREPTTRRGQRARVDFAGGAYGITSTDDRQPGAEAAIRQMAQQAVESANALMRQTGVDAAIDAFYAITESSIKGDRQGVASGGTLRIGDRLINFGLREASDMTLGGFGGWSEAEMLPRLAVDIQLSVLEAFQALGDQLPKVLSDMLEGIDVRSLGAEEAQALAERFAMLTQGASAFLAAVEQMPFVELRDLSFDAAAAMVQFAGGIDNLLTAQQTYYERFYSDAERHAHAVDQLTQALADVGVEMPALVGSTEDMLASYRALVEAQDLNTEEGQRAYVMLVQAAGAFADVAEFAGQAAVDLERAAEEQRRAAEQARQAVWDAAVAAGEAAYSALTRSVAAEKARLQKESQAIADALRNSISGASTTVNELTSLTGRLTSTVQRMIGQGLDEGRNRAWAQDRIDRALSVAKLTGVMPQGADFETALQVVAQPSQGLFDSFEDYQADFLRTAHTVSELNELAEGQLSTEKRALKALEDQLSNSQQWYQAEMERLDATLDYWRQQIDLEMGTYEAVLTIPQALAGIQSAIANIRLVAPPSVGGGGWSAKSYLANNPDVAAAYEAYAKDFGHTPESWAREHYENYGKWEGRSFDVGTNYVPYDMMALIHEGERIIPATDNRKLMQMLARGVDRDDAIRLLQQELREMRQMQQTLLEEIGRNTNDTARTNRQMVQEPQPVFVTNVVPITEAVPGQ